jgi:predicted metal-dependent hydrolase
MAMKSFVHKVRFYNFAVPMAKSDQKTYAYPDIGQVVFRRSARSRSISIRVHPVKGVSVTVPYIIPYSAARVFFLTRRDWVLETMTKQKERYKDVVVPSADEIESLRRQAKAELPVRLAQLASRYGFVFNRVSIKHNATNWGSCSVKGNINLNLNIVRLPRVLQDYVLLHELCHLRHCDHGHAFHLLLEHVCTDNMLQLIDEGDALALQIARKAAASRAKYPVHYVTTREIKAYRLV